VPPAGVTVLEFVGGVCCSAAWAESIAATPLTLAFAAGFGVSIITATGSADAAARVADVVAAGIAGIAGICGLVAGPPAGAAAASPVVEPVAGAAAGGATSFARLASPVLAA
jgi:hypothetical protein